MNDLTTGSTGLSTCTPEERAKLDALTEEMLTRPQVQVPVFHCLHGGMYARTAFTPKGTLFVGVELAKPSILVIQGDVTVQSGDKQTRFTGYNVVQGSEGRKVLGYAHEDTWATTVIVTDAKTVEEAEEAYTHEFEKLQSRGENYDSSHHSHCGIGSSGSGCFGVLGE